MTRACVSVLASQIEIQSQVSLWHLLFQFLLLMKKTYLKDFIQPHGFDDLMTFHHDFPNSHAPGFHFLEFLIYAFSGRSHSESAKLKAILSLQKISSIPSVE